MTQAHSSCGTAQTSLVGPRCLPPPSRAPANFPRVLDESQVPRTSSGLFLWWLFLLHCADPVPALAYRVGEQHRQTQSQGPDHSDLHVWSSSSGPCLWNPCWLKVVRRALRCRGIRRDLDSAPHTVLLRQLMPPVSCAVRLCSQHWWSHKVETETS